MLLGVRAARTTLVRIHRRIHSPVYFDRSQGGRFNAPAGEFGVCYFGEDLACSFLETLVRGSFTRVVPRSELAARSATTFELVRPLTLFRVHSDGLVHLSLTADFPHRVPYDDCQSFALNVWQQAGIDGIEYRSRWDDSLLCVALFDRAAESVQPAGERIEIDDLSRVRPILRRYDIGLI